MVKIHAHKYINHPPYDDDDDDALVEKPNTEINVGVFFLFPKKTKTKNKGTKSDVVWPSDSKYPNRKWSNFGTGAAHMMMPFN